MSTFRHLSVFRLLSLILVISASLVLSSCSKKEGCQDPNAINFDPEAEKDGTCNYTKVIFYAASDKVGGNGLKITKIEVYKLIVTNNELVGTVSDLAESNPEPSGCSHLKNLSYMNLKVEVSLLRSTQGIITRMVRMKQETRTNFHLINPRNAYCKT